MILERQEAEREPVNKAAMKKKKLHEDIWQEQRNHPGGRIQKHESPKMEQI